MVELVLLTQDQVVDRQGAYQEPVPYCYEQHWLEMFRQVFPHQLKGYRILQNGQEIGTFFYVVMKSRLWGNRIISLPFADEGGVMRRSSVTWTSALQRQVGEAVCRKIDEEAAGCMAGYVEIRGDEFLFNGVPDGSSFLKRKAYVKFVIDTRAPYEDIRKRFDSNIIKNLKKADRCVGVRECQSEQDLKELYRIYLLEMRRLGGLPLPDAYFDWWWRQKTSRILLATMDGEVIGFLLLLTMRKRVLADLNGSLPAANKFFPKVRLFDAAIRWSCANGFESFDLMRTRPGTGLYEHKKKWGGAEESIFYYTRVYNKMTNHILDADQKRFGVARFLVRLMPLCVLRNIGTPVRLGLGK